jgi:hypothetical protein
MTLTFYLPNMICWGTHLPLTAHLQRAISSLEGRRDIAATKGEVQAGCSPLCHASASCPLLNVTPGSKRPHSAPSLHPWLPSLLLRLPPVLLKCLNGSPLGFLFSLVFSNFREEKGVRAEDLTEGICTSSTESAWLGAELVLAKIKRPFWKRKNLGGAQLSADSSFRRFFREVMASSVTATSSWCSKILWNIFIAFHLVCVPSSVVPLDIVIEPCLPSVVIFYTRFYFTLLFPLPYSSYCSMAERLPTDTCTWYCELMTNCEPLLLTVHLVGTPDPRAQMWSLWECW